MRTIRPLDRQTIVESVKTDQPDRLGRGRVAVCRDRIGNRDVIMEQAFDYLDAPVMRVTGEDVPMPYAANLEKAGLAQSDRIAEAAKQVCYRTVLAEAAVFIVITIEFLRQEGFSR